MTIMITGGAGFVGSHTCVELIRAGHRVLIFDNFCNSHPEVVQRIARITGTMPALVRGDVRDFQAVNSALSDHRCRAVIHLAGLKSVSDSVTHASDYYDVNVAGSLTLARAMQNNQIDKIVFSSSATVYGEPESLPLREDHKVAPFSPYGRGKLMTEEVLQDIAGSNNPLRVAVLRYFNPVGCHESGLIGEDPHGVPNNLMPYISQVAGGLRPALNIYGNDYPTRDGTGIRDYVHVVDVAAGHLRALEQLDRLPVIKVNLGTGLGTSVLELVDAFACASDRSIPVNFAGRRPGDIASYYASADLALQILGWKAERDIAAMCESAWNWQRLNPNGYRDL